MTPQEIAREAAEAIASDVFNYDTELPQVKRDEIPAIAALILSAAAKMFRESGAVVALEQAREGHVSRRLTAIAALEKLRAIGEGKP